MPGATALNTYKGNANLDKLYIMLNSGSWYWSLQIHRSEQILKILWSVICPVHTCLPLFLKNRLKRKHPRCEL